MLTPTQKQRLEEKVREAVPESMELKFGCRVVRSTEEYIFLHMSDEMTGDIEKDMKQCAQLYCEKSDKIVFTTKIDKILGRPLTLQDVLIALNKSGEMIGVDDDGSFRSYPDGSRIHTYGGIGCSFNGEYMPAYDLTKDYHHQSDEFYTFLYELLCK